MAKRREREISRGEERSGEHKVVAVDESSSKRAVAARTKKAQLGRGSRIAALTRLEFGQANGSGVRIARTREIRTSSVISVEFAERAAIARAVGALARTAGQLRSSAIARVNINTSGGVNANEVLIVDGSYSRKEEKRKIE
ncbi:hypothetical protein Scep_024160 [Stephania cephalantha]|uniref:Uncharacterized protein n=1 Tax=Stephania cephalantha TaxID=152367 RepID=A0AAP0EYT0_9MAGN